MKINSSVAIEKNLAKLLKSTAHRLGYSSISNYVEALHLAREKLGYSKLDLDCLATYGKIPQVETVYGKSEKEVLEKLGLKSAHKVSETFPKIQVKVRAKKKQEQPQYFKGIEKPKGEI